VGSKTLLHYRFKTFVSFYVSLDYFGFVLLVSFVGFGFPVPSQEIGWKERFRNDYFVSSGA